MSISKAMYERMLLWGRSSVQGSDIAKMLNARKVLVIGSDHNSRVLYSPQSGIDRTLGVVLPGLEQRSSWLVCDTDPEQGTNPKILVAIINHEYVPPLQLRLGHIVSIYKGTGIIESHLQKMVNEYNESNLPQF